MTGGRVVVLGADRPQLRRRNERRHRLRPRSRPGALQRRARRARPARAGRRGDRPRAAARARGAHRLDRRVAAARGLVARPVHEGAAARLQEGARPAALCGRHGPVHARVAKALLRNGSRRRVQEGFAGGPAGARSCAAHRRLPRIRRHPASHGAARAGRALHGVRGAVLSPRLPAREPDPRLERPRLPRPLARGDRAAPPHEQLPGVHGPALPGAVRGGVRARDRRGQCRVDQAGRALDRQPRLGGGLDRPAAAARPHWPVRRSRRLRPGRARVRAAARARRRAGRRLRARRGGGRARPLRRSRVQDREGARRAPRAAARRRRRRVPLRRRRHVARSASRRARRRRARDRGACSARPARAGPRARRRPLRDGVPLRARPGDRVRPRGRRSAPPEST